MEYKKVCKECSCKSSEFVKEDIKSQGTIVTFRCSACGYEWTEEY